MAAKSIYHQIRSWIIILLFGGGAALAGITLTDLRPFRTLELKWLDVMYELRGPRPTDDSPVVLVAISEQSDYELPEKFPWPTSYYARLIDNLNEAGAAVIGLDVIFDKTDQYNPANDTLFAQAIARHGNVVLAGNVLREIQRAANVELRSSVSGQQLVQPIQLLNQANPNTWGFVSVERDQDSFLRRYPLQIPHLDNLYYAFGVQVLRVYFGLEDHQLKMIPPTDPSARQLSKKAFLPHRGGAFRMGELLIPMWDSRNMYINYVGKPGTFPEFNFSDVIDTEDFITVSEDEDFQINAFDDPDFGLLHEGVFEGKIVLIGSTMPELHDFYPTPFAPSGNMPGYESHANAIHTILTGAFITRLSVEGVLILILVMSLLMTLMAMRASLKWSSFMFLGTIVAYFFGVFHLFATYGYIVEMVGPIVTLTLSYGSSVVYGYFTEQKEKKRIRLMFGSYVAPELVDRMIASGEEPRLGGERSNVTAFFSDIQNFSSFSEKLSPEELVELMNEYLSAMTDILIAENGTLDKYIGDDFVAFFGAPVPTPDHASRACSTAGRMLQRQLELRSKWRAEGDRWPKIVHHMTTRIGLNSGDVITGNMGSARRFNYTMMGDNVNLAARCESGAKAYGVYAMVTEETRRQAETQTNRVVFRQLDRVVVKGRSMPVEMHELVGLQEVVPEHVRVGIAHYEDGLHHYFAAQWDAAEASFRKSAELEWHKDGGNEQIPANPSQLMLQRISLIRISPPPPDWNGVFVMKSK